MNSHLNIPKKFVNSKDFRNIVSALGTIYWTIKQFNAPKCPDCNQTLLFIGIDYCCIHCMKIPLRH